MDKDINSTFDFIKSYNLDYLGKYYFYEEDQFIKIVEEGEYILEKIKENNRFDYKGASYTISKFGNIVKNLTEKNVTVSFEKDSLNVKINGEPVHLDLIYKLESKRLEDHIRIATRISEHHNSTSCLMYIGYDDEKDFLQALEYVKSLQEKLASLD